MEPNIQTNYDLNSLDSEAAEAAEASALHQSIHQNLGFLDVHRFHID
jgi:hypothetical protein